MNLRGHHAPPWKGLREVRPSTVSSTHWDSGPRVMLAPNTMTGKELAAVVKEEQDNPKLKAINDSVCNVTGISLSRDMVDRHVESHSQTLSPESKIPSPTKRQHDASFRSDRSSRYFSPTKSLSRSLSPEGRRSVSPKTLRSSSPAYSFERGVSGIPAVLFTSISRSLYMH